MFRSRPRAGSGRQATTVHLLRRELCTYAMPRILYAPSSDSDSISRQTLAFIQSADQMVSIALAEPDSCIRSILGENLFSIPMPANPFPGSRLEGFEGDPFSGPACSLLHSVSTATVQPDGSPHPSRRCSIHVKRVACLVRGWHVSGCDELARDHSAAAEAFTSAVLHFCTARLGGAFVSGTGPTRVD